MASSCPATSAKVTPVWACSTYTLALALPKVMALPMPLGRLPPIFFSIQRESSSPMRIKKKMGSTQDTIKDSRGLAWVGMVAAKVTPSVELSFSRSHSPVSGQTPVL